MENTDTNLETLGKVVRRCKQRAAIFYALCIAL